MSLIFHLNNLRTAVSKFRTRWMDWLKVAHAAKNKMESSCNTFSISLLIKKLILKIILGIHDVTKAITTRAQAQVPSCFRAISPRVAFGLTASFWLCAYVSLVGKTYLARLLIVCVILTLIEEIKTRGNTLNTTVNCEHNENIVIQAAFIACKSTPVSLHGVPKNCTW